MRDFIDKALLLEEWSHPHLTGEDEWFKLYFRYWVNIDEIKRAMDAGTIKPEVVEYPLKQVVETLFAMDEFGSNDFEDDMFKSDLMTGPPVDRRRMRDIPTEKMSEAPLFAMFNADQALAISNCEEVPEGRERPVLVDSNHRLVRRYLEGDKSKVSCNFVLWKDLKKFVFPDGGKKSLADMEQDCVEKIDENEMVPYRAVTNKNLPQVIDSQMLSTGEKAPGGWIRIGDLPNQMLEMLRAMATEVFSTFTTTPIEQIHMVASAFSSDEAVRKYMHWIVENGQKEDEMEFDFSQQLAGAKSKAQVWRVGDMQFCLVKDFMGTYVYAWAANDKQIVHDPKSDLDLLR